MQTNEIVGNNIQYTNIKLPEAGSWQEVSEGVFWLRMPLPFALDHINLYLLEDFDNGGYALIDTGLGTGKTEALWELICAKLNKPLTKVIVTHMHPDHIGMAGYLVDKFRIPLYMSNTEYYTARAILAGAQGASDWQDNNYLIQCGMSDEYIEQARRNRRSNKGLSQVVKPIPLQFERLSEHQEIQIGKYNFQVLIGSGHSPEHVCLFDNERDILFSGDHVLPSITPNIGVYSTEPNANPLKQYLHTLKQFKTLPSNTFVLPSHKLPFVGLHTRVDQLIAHHNEHLHQLLEFCHTSRTVYDCLDVLFKRQLNQQNMIFAIAEAFSHLNYLYFSTQCSRKVNNKGQLLFTRT